MLERFCYWNNVPSSVFKSAWVLAAAASSPASSSKSDLVWRNASLATKSGSKKLVSPPLAAMRASWLALAAADAAVAAALMAASTAVPPVGLAAMALKAAAKAVAASVAGVAAAALCG